VNRTRLDSLQVGERFKMDSLEDSPVYIHRGYDARSGMQGYTRDVGPNSIRGDVWSLAEGSCYVVPLDTPPPVQERI
jgi:hypothetical protein